MGAEDKFFQGYMATIRDNPIMEAHIAKCYICQDKLRTLFQELFTQISTDPRIKEMIDSILEHSEQ